MKRIVFTLCVLCIAILGIVHSLQHESTAPTTNSKMGGKEYSLEPSFIDHNDRNSLDASVTNYELTLDSETIEYSRFFRPSCKEVKKNEYPYSRYETTPLPKFTKANEAVSAFFGVLEEASNHINCNIGCGSIGYNEKPYAVAYSLLTTELKEKQSLEYFKASFHGICHLSLLTIQEAYRAKDTPSNIRYYMVELESIEGVGITPQSIIQGKGMFCYYYGIVTVAFNEQTGWQIKDLAYIPENWLCAPYHGWNYDANYIVDIVFGSNMNLIDTITETIQEGDLIHVYASGKGGAYCFDFVRLTNGRDILLHQYKKLEGRWVETNYLDPKWDYLFFTPGLFE